MDSSVTYRDKSIGIELDAFLPKFKLGVEYCGLFYHNELAREDRHCHYKKWKVCEQNRIHLLTIYEDDWINKEEAIMSYIDLINTTDLVEFKLLNRNDVSKYLNQKWVENKYNYTNSLGVYIKDGLIGVILFSLNGGIANINLALLPKNAIKALTEYLIINYGLDGISITIDRRWFATMNWVSNNYQNGGELPPAFDMVKGLKRIKAENKDVDGLISGGWSKIWDCGYDILRYGTKLNIEQVDLDKITELYKKYGDDICRLAINKMGR